MFNSTIVPYAAVVTAARDTAERICARGQNPIRVTVTTFGGTTASVKWDDREATLNLPTMPASQMLSRAEANQIVGLIAHECCHVMHTSWPAWLAAVKDGTAIKELTNGIEDVRIEAREIARKALPGLKDALSDTMTMMHGKSLAACEARGTPIGTVASDASYVIAMLGRLANGYNVPCAKNLGAGIAPQWRPAIDYALQRIPGLANTAAAHALAVEVLAMLKAAAPQPMQPQPSDQGDQGDQGDQEGSESSEGDQEGSESSEGDQEGSESSEGDQEGSESSEGDQEGSESSEGDQEGSESSEGDQEGSESSEGDQEGSESSEGDQEGSESSEGDQEGSESSEGDQEGSESSEGDQEGSESSEGGQDDTGTGAGGIDDDAWLNASPSVDDIATNKGAADILGDYDPRTLKRTCLNNFRRANYRTRNGINEAWVVDVIKNRIPRPAMLADSVSRLVLSEARNINDRYLSSGRFDRRAIGRASWGASNVFARKAYAPGIETAVFLLLDGSDSMRADARMVDAQSLAYHLGQAIDDAGAQCAIGAFYADGAIMHRFDIGIVMAKDWHEPVDLGRIAALTPDGTTPLSAAIIAASELLATLDVDRRICLPLTDGQCDLGPDAVRDACAIAATMGVEVGGLGIGGNTTCADTFPVGVDLGAGANVSTAGLNLLVDMLERGRA